MKKVDWVWPENKHSLGPWRSVALTQDKIRHYILAGKWTDETPVAKPGNPNGLIAFADMQENTDAIAIFPELLEAAKNLLKTAQILFDDAYDNLPAFNTLDYMRLL